MRVKLYLCLFFVALFSSAIAPPALAKLLGGSSPANDENQAVVIGEAGEQYPIFGTGGIKVTGGHHGFWASNWKHSSIQIDGSGISAQKFSPVNESVDFTASVNCVHFVTNTSVCTLQTAVGAAGEEIVVCNASSGATITYQTTAGETLLASNQSTPILNSTPGKVDRFISDGKNWYRE